MAGTGRAARDERGAVLPIVAAAITVMVTMAAFAVDLGVQRVVRRDMQALADIVAIDLARELDGRSRAALAGEVATGNAGNALGKSLARNDDTIGDDLQVVATWGAWDGRTFDAAADPPTAVRVVASATTDFAFVDGDGSATRTAYAQADSTACYRLGSWAAAVRGADSALVSQLNRLVGLNLDLASYRGIADADLRLSQLVAHPSIGNGARLLDAPISYRDLVQVTIDALQAEEDPANEVAVRALRSVLDATSSTPAVTLGQVLGISATDSAALEADLDVLDLVLGSLVVANGQHALEVPNLQAGVPGVGNITRTTLAVWQGLTMACGTPGSEDTETTSSQVRGQMELEFANLPSINLNPASDLFNGTLQTGRATGVLTVDLGGAQGRLVTPPPVVCGEGTAAAPHTFGAEVTTALSTYRFVSDLEVYGTIQVGRGNRKVDAEVAMKVRLTMGTAVGPGGTPVPLSIPPNDTTPFVVGGDAVLLGSVVPEVLSSDLRVDLLGLGINLGALRTAVETAVVADLTTASGGFTQRTLNPLAAAIDTDLIGPVARLLGLRMGGADVYAVSAVCALPRLAG